MEKTVARTVLECRDDLVGKPWQIRFHIGIEAGQGPVTKIDWRLTQMTDEKPNRERIRDLQSKAMARFLGDVTKLACEAVCEGWDIDIATPDEVA